MRPIIRKLSMLIPIVKDWFEFSQSKINKVSIFQFIRFKLWGGGAIYWPVHKNSEVTHPQNILVGINSNPGTRPGCYIQGNGGIVIGNYVQFASNIGIISANHDFNNQMSHVKKEVRIDDYCWIGMNAVILPGVHLGPRTIVGAGAVVTKSFPDGYCVIAGNPAKEIKQLDKGTFIPTKFKSEYYGFVPKDKFKTYATKHLNKHKYFDLMIS